MSQALPSQPGTDVTIITVDYPPGGSTPPHEHPGYTYAYVLQGAVVSQLDDQRPITYKAGAMWKRNAAPASHCLEERERGRAGAAAGLFPCASRRAAHNLLAKKPLR